MELCLQVTQIRGSTTVTCPVPAPSQAPSQSFIQTLSSSPTRCQPIVTRGQRRTQRLWVSEQLSLTWSPDPRSLLFCNMHVYAQPSAQSTPAHVHRQVCTHTSTHVHWSLTCKRSKEDLNLVGSFRREQRPQGESAVKLQVGALGAGEHRELSVKITELGIPGCPQPPLGLSTKLSIPVGPSSVNPATAWPSAWLWKTQ